MRDHEHILVPIMEKAIVISYNKSEQALPVIVITDNKSEPVSPAVSPVKKLKTECGSTNLGDSGVAEADATGQSVVSEIHSRFQLHLEIVYNLEPKVQVSVSSN